MTAKQPQSPKARNLLLFRQALPDIHRAILDVDAPVPPVGGPTFNARFTLDMPPARNLDIPIYRFLCNALRRCSEEGIAFFSEPRTEEAYFLIVVGARDTEALLATLERMQARVVVIVEPSAAHLAGTLDSVDWQRVFAAVRERGGDLRFLIEPDTAEVSGAVWRVMRRTNPAAVDGVTLAVHGHGEFAGAIGRALAAEVSLAVSQLGFFHDELLMIANTYRNLRRPGARVFRRRPDANPGLAALIVGSGPSLDWAMDAIHRLRDRAVVVSAGSALRPLMANGIRPDFQVEIENIEVSPITRQAAAEHDLSDIRLIAASSMEPDATAPFSDIVYFFRKALSPYPLFAESDDRTLHRSGPTVVNAALNFAQDSGFREIYLFGADFGSQWPERHHAKDAFHYTEGSGHEHDGYPIEVEANFGGTCFTDHGLFSARASAAEAIQAMAGSRRVFNCSDGVAIAGATPLRPDEAVIVAPVEGKDTAISGVMDGFTVSSARTVADTWRDARLPAAVDAFVDAFAARLNAVETFADRSYHRDLMALLRPAMGLAETPARGTEDAANLLLRGSLLGMLIFFEYHRARVADPGLVERFGAIARDALIGELEVMRAAALDAFAGDVPAPPPDPEIWSPAADAVLPALPRISRNADCPCGSGKKFKHCHGRAA